MIATVTADVANLIAAINAGDGMAPAALADALEEASDPLATGLRRVVTLGLSPRRESLGVGHEMWLWSWSPDFCNAPSDVPASHAAWTIIEAAGWHYLTGVVGFGSPWDAIAALSEAFVTAQ